jgi:hypothetical protein
VRELVAIFAPIEMATSAEKCVVLSSVIIMKNCFQDVYLNLQKQNLLRNFTADDRTNSKWVEHPLKEFRI